MGGRTGAVAGARAGAVVGTGCKRLLQPVHVQGQLSEGVFEPPGGSNPRIDGRLAAQFHANLTTSTRGRASGGGRKVAAERVVHRTRDVSTPP